ncbi:MAG TPA: cbb3-type cytochrome c oxidase subunit I [Polyangia bacterium]
MSTVSSGVSDLAVDLQPSHEPPRSWLRRHVFSTDHKVIARQFLWTGLLLLLFGGVLAMLIRWQLGYPGQPVPVVGKVLFAKSGGVISPAAYTSLFTMHGLVMIFFAVTPLLIGTFGNFIIPLQIGARDMAFPRLNMLSFWTFLLSVGFLIASFFAELGSAQAGWTTYPPLSTKVGTPGHGQTLVIVSIFVTGAATIMGAINYVITVIRFRAPGMTWMRLPLSVWGLWLTSILNIMFVPVLSAAALLLFLDRVFGTQFFIAGAASVRGGGDPILFQHLFWIFGHPEVYILILPAWGFVSDFVAYFARKPAYWYKGSVWAMIAVTVLSAVVYGHHMFTTGMNPMLGKAFMILTLLISAPAELLFLNWLHTIWKGSMRTSTPMLFTLGVVFVFALGGLTGLFLATISTDLYLHDTMFVVGHFHFTMAAATFLAIFAALYFWFPKMFGRPLGERLGKVHFWFSVIGLTLVFGGQLLSGYAGQPRRLWDPHQYEFLKHLMPLSRWTSVFAFALGMGQLAFVWNFFASVFGRAREMPANPWQVGTLEWTLPSPPAFHNFDRIPVVHHGPHELSNPDVQRALGRDWIAQDEALPGGAAPAPSGATS